MKAIRQPKDGPVDTGPEQQGAVPAPLSATTLFAATLIDFNVLKERVPASARSLREWTRRGLIPSIRPVPGGRIFYHWPSVEAALVRMQRGGVE